MVLPFLVPTEVPLTVLKLVESVAAGALTGFLSGLLGVGGGFIMIPLLTLMGVPIHTAVGTCLAFVACSSLAALLQHARQGSIDPIVAVTMTLPAALSANVAARFASGVAPAILHLLFSGLLVTILLMYYFSPVASGRTPQLVAAPLSTSWYVLQRHRTVRGAHFHYTFHLPKAILSGVATGLLSGFFGIGGGVFLVPLTAVVLRIPLQVTAGTTLAIFLLPAIVGSVTHWRLGNVDVGLWLPLVVAGIIGGQFGARYVVRLPVVLLKRLFLLLVCAGAVFMLAKGLTEVHGG